MVWVENLKRFLLSKIHQEKVFGHVLLRKQVFSDDRNMDLKKRKIAIFAKGIVHDFGQKVEVFHLLCLSTLIEKKCFLTF